MKRLKLPQIILGVLVAGAMLVTVPGSVPNFPEQATAPTGYADGVPQWDAEPSIASLLAGEQRRYAEQFYFVLPDRFANGDPGNDKGGLPGDRLNTGHDPSDKGFYHGGDLKGVIDRLDYIQNLGTTAIWLAPVLKNRPVQGSGADISAGYHGYWTTDFTEIDPHFGTKDDLKRLVRLAHQRGMKIYLDVITNHTADVIRYQQNQYTYRDKTEYPYRDSNGNRFDDRNFADGKHGFPQVNTQSFPYTPVFGSEADKTAKKPSWLNDPLMYHNRGDSTFSGENSEYGDFFGLDDLWTERPEVVKGMTKIYADWVKDTGIDGYRIDTTKHVNMEFWPQFVAGINKVAKPGFFMFGEVYDARPEIDSLYVRKGRLPATLDFPFQQTATDFAARGGSAADLAEMYAQDDLYTSPGTTAGTLPTFLGNHDMGRIGTFVAGGGTDPATHLRRDQLAHELMFLSRGQPVVYSGDEQGFTGNGGDKDARQDMFPSVTADYLDDDLLGTDNTHAVANYDQNHPVYRTIADLGKLRQAHPALKFGVQVTRHAAQGQGVFAFSRVDPQQRVEYVVATNNAGTTQTVTLPTYMATTTFDRIYPTAGLASSAGDGTIEISVPPLTTVVFKARGALAKPAAKPTVKLVAPPAGAAVPSRAEVKAEVTGDPLATVTFAARVGNGPWKLLGTDHAAPYTVYHDLDGLPAGTALEYKAVVRDGAGRTAETRIAAKVGTPPSAAAADYAIVHYQRPAGGYEPWSLYAWGDIETQMTWPVGAPFAGEDAYGRFAWVKLKPGAANVGFLVVDANGVKDVAADRTIDPTKQPEIWLKQGDATIYTSQAAATGTVAVHYGGRADGDHTGWGLHLWGDGLAPGTGTDWATPRPPDATDSYGPVWHVPVTDPAKPVNFIVHRGDVKDPGADQSVVPARQGEAWVRSGEPAVHPTRAAAERTVVLHYRRPAGDYTGWGLHVWTGAATPTEWAAPLLPEAFDAFGARFRVPLAADATILNYIVHNGDAKDLPADQTLDLADVGHEVWVLSGQERYLLPMPAQGTPDTDLTKAKAVLVDRETVAWRAGPTDGHKYELLSAPAGGLSVVDGQVVGTATALPMRAVGSLTEPQRAKFPHLWAYQAFHVAGDRAALTEALRGQVVAVERDAAGKVTEASAVQIAGGLDDLYAGAVGAKLGPRFDGGRPTVSVWAPTAQNVSLELFDSPAAQPVLTPMRRDGHTGVWSVTGERSWRNKFYRFKVTAWQPAVRGVATASVTDPYSVSLAANSTHSQLVDLADGALQPSGWASLKKPPAPNRPQIQEVSVRDFSIADSTVPAGQRGTYLAFTQAQSAGMTHLRKLAQAGTSYVHLLPVFDISTIPERRADQLQPPCDLAALPADSPQQQACIAQIADRDGYNWGYDPLHYSTPEGSYATDPQGSARITEFRQMVAGLNGAGLRVVMDVVYNHTTAAGAGQYSVLDQIVPGYYHRLLDDGAVATSTCCANTAPENAMMGKLVVESIVLWAKQYKVDGFRFDLMGHHPKANMLAVRAALDQLTVSRDGVDGKKILLYGEGWNFGEVANDARFEQATQANMAGTGIGTFNDRLRDAVRGGGPFDGNPRIQGFATGLYTDPNGDPANGTTDDQRARLLHYHDLIQVGLTGNLAAYEFVGATGSRVTGAQVDYNGSPAGYTMLPGEGVTYVDAHDNEILYDAMAFKLPTGTTAEQRARMQILALSTTVFGQGTGFVTTGSDRLRSKSMDRNSFNSGDWFNQIRWNCADGNGFGAGLPPAADNQDKWAYSQPLLADPALIPDCAAIDLAAARFQELQRIRASSPVFGLDTAAQVQQRVAFPLSGPGATPGVITMTIDARGIDRQWRTIVVVFNAGATGATQTVDAVKGAPFALHPVQTTSADPIARQATYDSTHGTFTVPARTVSVFVRPA